MAEERFKTKYPGVDFVLINKTGHKEKKDKSYIVTWYDKNIGKNRSERVGREWRDGMTPAKANLRRVELIRGASTRKEERKIKRAEKENRWILDKISEEYIESNPSLRGTRVYKNIWDNYIGPNFGHLTPEEVEESEVNELKNFLLGDRYSNKFSKCYFKKNPGKYPDSFKGYSKSYVNNILEIIRRTTNWGSNNIKVNGKYIKGLSFRVKMIKNVNNEKTGYLSIEQRGALIKAAKEYPYKPIGNLILFLFSTGCRKGEAFRLRWQDIKWDEGIIELSETKSGAKQYIPLTETVRNLLNNHHESFPPKDDCPYVFPSKNGKMLIDIRKTAKTIFKNAGLPEDFRIHDLRHAYACALAESGISIEVISKLLRHHSIAITEKRYVRYSPKYLGKEAEVIGKIFEEATGEVKMGKVLPFPKKS